jgi:hypothetical protein
VTLKGEVLDQDLPGTACPLCRGAAVLAGAAAMPELQRSMAASQRLYEVEQRRRQLDDFQGIWLPYGFSDGLAVRQIADLKKGYGVWCPACLGFGQTGCATCGGTALLKCPNASCVQGTEVCSDCQGKGRKTSTSGSATTLTKRCDTCGGAGKRRCDACSGKGHVPCPDCAERGVLTCKKCSGTGHPAPCTKCSGEGLAVCTRCAGKGQANGPPCTYCQGQGASLCTSCLGTGRERSK